VHHLAKIPASADTVKATNVAKTYKTYFWIYFSKNGLTTSSGIHEGFGQYPVPGLACLVSPPIHYVYKNKA
jgi:hypothetical protein